MHRFTLGHGAIDQFEQLTVVVRIELLLQLARGGGTPREDAARLMGLLRHLLQETREYRKYFARADKDALISL